MAKKTEINVDELIASKPEAYEEMRKAWEVGTEVYRELIDNFNTITDDLMAKPVMEGVTKEECSALQKRVVEEQIKAKKEVA